MAWEPLGPLTQWAEREPIVLWGLRLSDATPGWVTVRETVNDPIVLWGLRLSDATPAGRRALMWVYLGAAALAAVAGHGLPGPLRPLAVLPLMMCI